MPQNFRKPKISHQELSKMLEDMQLGDPMGETASFRTFKREEMIELLKGMGVSVVDMKKASNEDIMKRLRLALWDSQRLDLMFPGKSLDGKRKVRLNLESLPSWPKWRDPRPELRDLGKGLAIMDGFKDAERLDTYIFRHFPMSSFTPMENMKDTIDPKPGMPGAWVGLRCAMSKGALDITRDGGADSQLLAFHSEDSRTLLVLELLDVKQAKWTEPTSYQMKVLKDVQKTKFGRGPSDPLVPMILPKKGSLLIGHVLQKLAKTMSDEAAKEKINFYTGCSQEVSEDHLRTFVRVLDANADLLDTDYVEETQSHWKGVSKALAQQTRISFFSPCLRLRWSALEEVETGKKPWKADPLCAACGKKGMKPVRCAGCKAAIYCNAECSKAHWESHKPDCTLSTRLSNVDVQLPKGKWYVPARCYHDFAPNTGFAILSEMAIHSGCPPTGECAPNEYGTERFILRTSLDPQYCVGGLPQFRGTTVFMWDRRRSFLLRAGLGDNMFAKKYQGGRKIPFHRKGYEEYVGLVKSRGFFKSVVMLWAKRIGDSIEIDLKDIPKQSEYFFN
ncbi:ankyrin repeat and mynd domain-containing protein 2-like [Moniliophthora roreri MCA 2997]|uniref:Ankyrin repeat and mynd domain-containing protein 2-like n=1 Tax=Moniliophthora roreri (strain MCA 2997) TaxID=1381753 RepID=V2X1G8_MONRO|nr:ankyrin repeat and mynd domain-containing protein 2-like [Moniliophthora roreri MCA 2997]